LAKISVDTPLAEITLRKYEKPNGESRRELVRKLCLSLGLLQPGDSRDVIVDVLQVMLESDSELTSTEVEHRVIERRKAAGLELLGIAPSNIRRQLLRLRDMFIVEKVKNNYRIRERTTLKAIFEENIEKYYLASIIGRVKEYADEVDRTFLLH
jgi:DNA-binding transcriptional ArsR family regulator